jgi:hypothetical protein
VNLARSWASPRSTFVRWLIGVAPWLLAVTIVVIVVQREDRAEAIETLRAGPRASATVVSVDGDEVHVEYDHVIVGSVNAVLRDDELEIGDRVTVVYDRDDPYRVLLGSARPQPDLLVVIIAIALAGAAVTIGVSQWTARQTRRLATAETTAFRMLAVIHRGRWSVVPRLSLYPLDAGAGESSVCTVRLADISARSCGSGVDEVEVKGLPRPGGRVVVRRDDVILWPRGRALVSEGQHGLASNASQAPPFAPPTGQPSPGPVWHPSINRARERHPWYALRWVALAAAAGVVITLVVASVAIARGRATDRWTAAGLPAVATIADRDDTDFTVAVDVAIDGEPAAARSMMAPVDFPEEYEEGHRYPAVVSADFSHVRLLVEPYDRVEPILWFAIPTAILLWHLGRRLLGG